MNFRKTLAVVLALLLVFTLTSCQKKEEVKEVAEEYEIIIETGFVPFKLENATPVKYEAIGDTTSKITAEFDGSTYIFMQTQDLKKDLTNGEKDFETTEIVYINGTAAMLGYNAGSNAIAIWGNNDYTFAIICENNFDHENFTALISGNKLSEIEDTGAKVEFSAPGLDAPTLRVNIVDSASGTLFADCPCFIIKNPADAAVLTLSAPVADAATASVDGLIFAGEFDEESNAFALGEQLAEIVGQAETDDAGEKYVYDVENPYPDSSESIAFAVGADIIAGSNFCTGEMVVVVLEP